MSSTEERTALELKAQRASWYVGIGGLLVLGATVLVVVGGVLGYDGMSRALGELLLFGMLATALPGASLFGAGFLVRRHALRQLEALEARRLPPARVVT